MSTEIKSHNFWARMTASSYSRGLIVWSGFVSILFAGVEIALGPLPGWVGQTAMGFLPIISTVLLLATSKINEDRGISGSRFHIWYEYIIFSVIALCFIIYIFTYKQFKFYDAFLAIVFIHILTCVTLSLVSILILLGSKTSDWIRSGN